MQIKLTTKLKLSVSLCLLVAIGALGYLVGKYFQHKAALKAYAAIAKSALPAPEVFPYSIKRGSTISQTLGELGFSVQDIEQIVSVAKDKWDLRHVPAGLTFRVQYAQPELHNGPQLIKFKVSATEYLEVARALRDPASTSPVTSSSLWQAQMLRETVDVQLVTYAGNVESSLWESAEDAKMDPTLIAELTEIFAWQIDFAREVRPGDRWRLSVEQHLVRGQTIGWGRILAAEYENAGQTYAGILMRKEAKDFGYFAPDGSSLRRMFLKSPMRFGRISSRFSFHRFHPILQRTRPHLGVDYAAPTGTPVRAVGDGQVFFVGVSGGGGKTVRVRHTSVYQTAYKHLSGYAPGIRNGARVRQGQVIAYVGQSGLATGPHLHFEFWESGRYVDPLSKRFPSADPVPAADLPEFQLRASAVLKTLPPWFKAGVSQVGPVVVLGELSKAVIQDRAR